MPDLQSWQTAVTSVADGSILYRGTSVVELISDSSIERVIWDLLVGKASNPQQLDAVRRAVIAAADHGVAAPSVASARICASTQGPPGVAVASGLLAFAGPAHGGAAEAVANLLVQLMARPAGRALEIEVVEIKSRGQRVPGFGHPVHASDPRVPGLLSARLADRAYRDLAIELERVMLSVISPRLHMNADTAVAALLLDTGLAPEEVMLLTTIGRTIGLAAHVAEERREEKPFRSPALSTIAYVGTKDRLR